MEGGFLSAKVFVVTLLLIAYASAYTIGGPHSKVSLFAEGSCEGRCNQTGTVPGTCQCNKPCMRFGDCCDDYVDLCEPGTVTDKELEDLAEELLSMDTMNNATAYITIDLNARGSEPLLTVSEQAFNRTMIAKLVKMHDNYNADVKIPETITPEEQMEIDDFMDALFETPIMRRAQEFLESKKMPTGKDSFFTLWFQLYDRGGTDDSSSAFEHVYLGELNNGVGGFHNWEFYSRQQDAGKMSFNEYMNFYDFGSKGAVIEHSFRWQNVNKPISSMFIGTSPEFEMALYLVCFHSRSNSLCPISLDGNKMKIQTYTLNSERGLHIGTAYPDLNK